MLKIATHLYGYPNRLKAIGIAPKSALVDITNYICITFDQPMHCYDKAKISGNLFSIVKRR